MINNFMFQFLKWIIDFQMKESFVKDEWIHHFKRLNRDNLIDLESIYKDTYSELIKNDLITLSNGFINITPAGREAYSVYLNEIEMPNSNLKISLKSLDNEESSVIEAREANKLSKEANKKSGHANIIAIISLIVAAVSVIVAITSILIKR